MWFKFLGKLMEKLAHCYEKTAKFDGTQSEIGTH